MNPQISIITPVLNGVRFIDFCIRNVIKQNCLDMEHVIIDGGSTDGTVDVIKEYAARYGHIRWVSEKDNGLSHAWNKGVCMSRGSILGFVNADDYYEQNVLNRVLEIFKDLPEPSFIAGKSYVWDDDGRLRWTSAMRKTRFEDLLLGNMVNPFPQNETQYFYHKSLHDKIGYFDESLRTTMDFDFILRVAKDWKIRYHDEYWGNFRLIKGTLTLTEIETGECRKRVRAMIKRYRRQLPWWKRIGSAILFTIVDSKFYGELYYYRKRLRHHLRNPKPFLKKLFRMN